MVNFLHSYISCQLTWPVGGWQVWDNLVKNNLWKYFICMKYICKHVFIWTKNSKFVIHPTSMIYTRNNHLCMLNKEESYISRTFNKGCDWLIRKECLHQSNFLCCFFFFFLNTWEHYPVGMCRIVLDEIWKDAFSFEKKDLVNSQICMQKTI